MTSAPLQLHVELDLIKRHVSGAFHHDLHASPPGTLSQLTDRLKFAKLRLVGRIGESAWTQSVTDAEGHVVSPQDVADVIPCVVHGILLAMREHPLGKQ